MNDVRQPEQALGAGVDAENPWPGLVAFTEELQEYFYGRHEEADDLMRRVGRKNLTVLFGQSGLGKSSLLQAGLFPRLRAEGYLPVAIRLDHAATAPVLSHQVIKSVCRAIIDTGGQSEPAAASPSEALWEHFHRRSLILQTADGRQIRPVLVFDQFEELFAIGQASEETRARAATFLIELADFVENRTPDAFERRLEDSPELVKQFIFDDRDYRILVCLREDYLAHLESLRQSMPSSTENRMRLTRMNGKRAIEAVINPGRRLIAPDVAQLVVRFVAGGRRDTEGLEGLEVEPSLLSLVCRELNNRRLATGLPQITADLLAGNRDRILQDFYDRCVSDQPPAVRAFVEDELVTDSGLRENIALERARKSLAQRGVAPGAIDELVKRRLLRLEDRLDVQRVELTHDVLTSVVKTSRDDRQQHEASVLVERRAQEVREKARGQRRRLTFIVAGMAAALVAMSGFGMFSFHEWREAERQKFATRKALEIASGANAHAKAALAIADRSFDEARATVDELSKEFSQEGQDMQVLRQRLAQIAVDRYEGFAILRPDDDAVVDGRARSLTVLGIVTGQAGSLGTAVSALEKAAQIEQKLVESNPSHPNISEHRFRAAQARFELGFLYWSVDNFAKARPCLEQAVASLESLAPWGQAKREYGVALARAFDRLASVLDRDTATRDRAVNYYARSRELFQSLCKRYPDDTESLFGLAIVYERMYRREESDAKSLELLDLALSALEKARKVRPNSPQFLLYRGFHYLDRTDQLLRLNRSDEALRSAEEAIASLRSAVKENPLVPRYQMALNDGLKKLAGLLTNRKRLTDAEALHKEAVDVLEVLTQRFDDRPAYGAALVEKWERFAEFYLVNKGDKSDEAAQQQSRLRCLDQAVQVGRRLSKRFPGNAELHFQLAEALFQRAFFDSSSDRNQQAFPLYLECVATFQSLVSTTSTKPTAAQLRRLLLWMDLAQQCAESLKRTDEVLEQTQLAYDLGKNSSDRDVISALGTLLSRKAKVRKNAGRWQEAIAEYARALEIREPAFEKAPWHWFLRSDLSDDYKGLAECFEKTGDVRGEVHAWRKYLRIWSGPMHGMKVSYYVDPARPSDQSEATRLRQFAKSTPETKQFNYNYDLGGASYSFTVHITNLPWPKDPLEDQARCLQERNGGVIPTSLRDSFRRLHKYAYENNLSFVEYCQSVIRTSSGSEPVKAELKKTKAKCTAQIAVLTQASSTPTVATQMDLARAYADLGAANEELAELKESIQAYERSLQLYLSVQEQSPDAPDLLRNIATTEHNLGNLYDTSDVKEYTKAYAAYQRALDSWRRLPSQKEELAHAGIVRELRALGLLCKIAFSPTEAAHWYLKAVEEDDTDAASRLASIYLEHAEISVAMPESIRRILLRVTQDTKNDPRAFKSLFGAEVANERQRQRNGKNAELLDLAAHYKSAAIAHKAPEKRSEYRNALKSEFQIHGQRVKLMRADQQPKNDQAGVAAELADSFLEANENAAAVEWATVAGELGHTDSLLRLSDWYEKGTLVKADIKQANHYGYLGRYARGLTAFNAGRYKEASEDFRKVCESVEADADDYDKLGRCYGKLQQWDDALNAYTRSIELDLKSDRANRIVLSVLEALLIAGHPDRLHDFVKTIQKKGWELSAGSTVAADYASVFHGFRAIALLLSGKESFEAEEAMREFTGKPEFRASNWNSADVERWLKENKLAPEVKPPVERIVLELKQTNESLLQLADAYETGKGGAVDLKKSAHYRYLARHKAVAGLFNQGRYAGALPDLKKICESAEAGANDFDTLGMCYGKLGQWDDAIRAYTRSVEIDLQSERATAVVLNLLEALTCAERSEQLLKFVRDVEHKGWKLPTEGSSADKFNALFHGFRAIALKLSGMDASEAEQAMSQFTSNAEFKINDWTWDELNGWLKTTKLARDRKAAVEKIVKELQGVGRKH
jgi:tetratricopeptide (TPR) repeat protein